jgi:hypothetical protein
MAAEDVVRGLAVALEAAATHATDEKLGAGTLD